MKQNIKVTAEHNELILENSHGDKVIIPANKRDWVKQKLSEGCHGCIDSLVETLPVMEDYAQDGSLLPDDKKNNFKYKPYTAVQDNTYVAPKVVMPLELKKKQQFVPRELPVLKADTRTDQERKTAQKYTESVLNPSISTQIGETLQKPLRWLADPIKGVGDVVSAIAPNSPLAKDLPNTNAETFEHRKKQLSPYISNKEKINSTINEAIPLTNWALLNTLPVEAAAGNMVKSGKNLIKPVSKVVGKTDDATKAGRKVLNKTDDVVKSSASLVDDAAYPVTRTTPNSGYTFKTISPNKEKIAIHESNKYHDLMWVAKNDIDNFFINNKIDVSKLPESKLVGSEVGYDWILPEGITHDMLNEFARLHHGKPITQEMRNIAKAIKEANPNVKFNGTSHELHGIASNIHPEYLGKMGQGLSNVTKAGSKVLNKTDDVLSKIGTPLNRSIDIHDIRKKYHNDLILQPDEIKLLQREGKGNRTNYRNVSGTDIAGKIHQDDIKPKEINFDRNSIEELLFGKDYGAEKVPTKSNVNTLNDIKLNNSNKSIFEENKLNIKSYKDEIEDLIKDFKTDISVFERTETSMKADKWLNDWFTHPETKKAFINYGGTEKEWVDILNTLENPIRSSVKYGKGQPGGVYMDVFKQASIPINAKVDVGVHEGIHKTGLLLKKSNPILNELWNDFTDAVREIPTESYPEIFRLRYNMGLKPGQKIDMETLDKGLKTIKDGYSIPNKIKDKNKLLDIINKAPALVPFLGTYLQSQQQNKNEQ